MPCTVEGCRRCGGHYCQCGLPEFEAWLKAKPTERSRLDPAPRPKFDWEGAFCDAMQFVEKTQPGAIKTFEARFPVAMKEWRAHQRSEKGKKI